jgi:hypothetical protein
LAEVEETRPRINMLSAQAAAVHPGFGLLRRLGTNGKAGSTRDIDAAFRPEGGIIFFTRSRPIPCRSAA